MKLNDFRCSEHLLSYCIVNIFLFDNIVLDDFVKGWPLVNPNDISLCRDVCMRLRRDVTNRNQTDLPMKSQPQIPNTKPVFIRLKMQIFNQILRRLCSIYRQNTKKIPRHLGQKYQIPTWYLYFLGVPNFWLPIDISM